MTGAKVADVVSRSQPLPLPDRGRGWLREMDLNRKLITSDTTIVNATLEKTPLINNNNSQDDKSVLQSWRGVIAELRGPHRLWSTTLIALLTSLTALLGGYTLAYPSSALLDLNDLNNTRVFRHGSVLENIFGVSTSKYVIAMQCLLYNWCE